MTDLDWRDLEHSRLLMQPYTRRVHWACDHLEHEPTDGRGPLRRSQHKADLFKKNDHNPFAFRPAKGAA